MWGRTSIVVEKSIEKSIGPSEEEVEEEGDWDGAEEEGGSVMGQKNIEGPPREEYDAHMQTHIAYRKWFPFCLKGKRASEPHRVEKEKGERKATTIWVEYMWQ